MLGLRIWLGALDDFRNLAHPPRRLTVDMRLTCTHAYHMSKMVQIRNVPEALHRKLKVRAAGAGQTLSDYLLAELERLAARPTRDEMLTRLHGRKRVTLKTPAAVVVREERESA
jgi:plasmid stability protein